MDVTQAFAATALGLLLMAVLLRVFARPLRAVGKLLLNTALGFGALFLLRVLEPVLGVTLGLNVCNAAVIGVLGVPGLLLLMALRWLL